MSAPPAFPDISKSINNLLGKDFYHNNKVSVDVKSAAPNGVAFTYKAKTGKTDVLDSSVEAKYADKAAGLTITQGWNSANLLNTKVELVDILTPGLKAEVLASVVPSADTKGAKINFYWTQPQVNIRGFFDLLKGPTFAGDATFGYENIVTGVDVGYDISNGKVSRLAMSLGYLQPSYSVSLNTSNSFSVHAASYYQKVAPGVEVGAKAVYSAASKNAAKPVDIEAAAKYAFDKSSFAKVKIADSGAAAFAFSQVLSPGVTLGLGLATDILNYKEPVNKIGASLSFAL